ncbi:hypothetical protein SteCoe_31154 [Stentor coeruleus]|uniref:Uncharacterized protein n=1 Tax=Stentor coeruleus TaxID=5963 RepID=A0A1R2B1X5_9CILI|nr:hypothetical protein SteCoe_31154 [Stentor coeruleus]
MSLSFAMLLSIVCVNTENILFSYDVAEHGISPEPRSNPAMAVDSLGNFLYLFGGRSKCCFLDDLWTFDLSKLVWSLIYAQSNCPEPRSNSQSFFRSKTQEFCIYSGNSDEFSFSDLWCFSTHMHSWNKINHFEKKISLIAKTRYLEYNEKEYLIVLPFGESIAYIFNLLLYDWKIIFLNTPKITLENAMMEF